MLRRIVRMMGVLSRFDPVLPYSVNAHANNGKVRTNSYVFLLTCLDDSSLVIPPLKGARWHERSGADERQRYVEVEPQLLRAL